MRKRIFRKIAGVFACVLVLSSSGAGMSVQASDTDSTAVGSAENTARIASATPPYTLEPYDKYMEYGDYTTGDTINFYVKLPKSTYSKVVARFYCEGPDGIEELEKEMYYDGQSGYYVGQIKVDNTYYNSQYTWYKVDLYGDEPNTGFNLSSPPKFNIYGVTHAGQDDQGEGEQSQSGRDEFVARLYTYILGRPASAAEISSWSNVLAQKSNTGSEVAYGFFFSSEFLQKNVSDDTYVELLYNAIFGRSSDQGGKQGWLNTLNTGVSRMHVFKGFTDSSEWAALCQLYGIEKGSVDVTEPRDVNSNTTAFVYRLYTVALSRVAEADGLNAWVAVLLENRETPKQVAAGFIFSDEFESKQLGNGDYVDTLYRTFMGREADAAGRAAWVAQLDRGVSRVEVFEGFANSPEFSAIIASFGL